MTKHSKVDTLPPGESGTPEALPSQNETTEAAATNDAAGGERQGASATSASDCPEAATSPVSDDAIGNPDLPAQSTNAGPSPADPGTAELTSPQDDRSAPGAATDEAEAESRFLLAPSNTLENSLPPIGGGSATEPAGADDGGCFKPFFRGGPASLYHQVVDGWEVDPTDTRQFAELPYHGPTIGIWNPETAQPSGIADAPALPPPPVATAADLITWVKRVLLAQTILLEDLATLVAFWVISTWFQDKLDVVPCLLITGTAHDAMDVLHVLRQFCRQAALLAGFQRSDLGVNNHFCTNLISEPNLDRRTANLLIGLTDRRFLVVGRSYPRSIAIYAGEDPERHKIENSIHIHLAPINAAPPARPPWLQTMMKRVPIHLGQYHDKNLDYVRDCTWFPSSLSSETAVIATALGRCIVDAPELREKLLELLQTRDQQRRSEMSDTTHAVVVEAILTLSRDGREHAYCREIAATANRLFEVRTENVRLRAEHVGHRCKHLGLRTCRLSRTGNGLRFDKATVDRINELAAMYMVDVMEDVPAGSENLHSSQDSENKQVEEVMEVVEVS